ncbi:MAG: Wzz/FepE/Etk N-terminal domain-containing protein [Methyloligellaceae bacterium]
MMTEKETGQDAARQSAADPVLPPVDPRILATMYGQPYEEDEIGLLEYWRVIWSRRKMILAVSFGAALLAAGVSLLMPDIYRAEALLAPVSTEESKSGLASALGSLGGLASMAGISMGGGGSTEENIAILKSREFIWKFVKDKKLMPVLFEDEWDIENKRWQEKDPEEQPGPWDAYRLFTEQGLMNVSTDKDSGLVTVAVEWSDPELAASWSNELVSRLNEYLRQQAIARSDGNLKYLNKELNRTQVAEMRQALFELISQEQKKTMLANTQEEFAFRVLDAAVTPDKKAKPKRALIVILATFVAGFIGILIAFIQEGMQRRREREAANESPSD